MHLRSARFPPSLLGDLADTAPPTRSGCARIPASRSSQKTSFLSRTRCRRSRFRTRHVRRQLQSAVRSSNLSGTTEGEGARRDPALSEQPSFGHRSVLLAGLGVPLYRCARCTVAADIHSAAAISCILPTTLLTPSSSPVCHSISSRTLSHPSLRLVLVPSFRHTPTPTRPHHTHRTRSLPPRRAHTPLVPHPIPRFPDHSTQASLPPASRDSPWAPPPSLHLRRGNRTETMTSGRRTP